MTPFPDSKSQALYQQAIDGQWNAAHALDWSTLSFERVAPQVRGAMATVYGDILYAEAFGVGMIGRMVEHAPEGWLREFARVQAGDEARHVDFFSRVMAKLGGVQGESAELGELRAELDSIVDYDELILHGQIIETAARVIFVGNGVRTLERMATGIKLPGSESIATLLGAVVDLVGRDESRHIAFGTHCLRKRLACAGTPARHELERRARMSARLMYRAFAGRSSAFRLLGASPSEVLDRTWQALRTQLGRLELDIGDAES